MINTKVTIAAAASIALFAAIAMTSMSVTLHSQSTPRAGFTIHTVSESFRGGKVDEAHRTETISAFSSNGSTSKTTFFQQEDPVQEIFSTDRRTVATVDPLLRAYYDMPLHPEGVARRKSPILRSCEDRFNVACEDSMELLGLATKKVTIAPAGSNRQWQIWVSPKLNWEALREEVYDTTDGKHELNSRSVAVDVVIGEPDSKTFEIPAGFTRSLDSAEHLRESATARGHALAPGLVEKIRERERMKRERLQSQFGVLARLRIRLADLASRL